MPRPAPPGSRNTRGANKKATWQEPLSNRNDRTSAAPTWGFGSTRHSRRNPPAKHPQVVRSQVLKSSIRRFRRGACTALGCDLAVFHKGACHETREASERNDDRDENGPGDDGRANGRRVSQGTGGLPDHGAAESLILNGPPDVPDEHGQNAHHHQQRSEAKTHTPVRRRWKSAAGRATTQRLMRTSHFARGALP